MGERKHCRLTIPMFKRKFFFFRKKEQVLISMKENIGTYTNNSYHTIYCKYSLTEIDDPASEGS